MKEEFQGFVDVLTTVCSITLLCLIDPMHPANWSNCMMLQRAADVDADAVGCGSGCDSCMLCCPHQRCTIASLCSPSVPPRVDWIRLALVFNKTEKSPFKPPFYLRSSEHRPILQLTRFNRFIVQ